VSWLFIEMCPHKNVSQFHAPKIVRCWPRWCAGCRRAQERRHSLCACNRSSSDSRSCKTVHDRTVFLVPCGTFRLLLNLVEQLEQSLLSRTMCTPSGEKQQRRHLANFEKPRQQPSLRAERGPGASLCCGRRAKKVGAHGVVLIKRLPGGFERFDRIRGKYACADGERKKRPPPRMIRIDHFLLSPRKSGQARAASR
jgi:hypothetical protein